MSAAARRWTTLACALVPLVLAAAVLRPVLGRTFYKDDYLHLYQLRDSGALEFLLTPHAGHIYLARNAVFLLCHALFGLQGEGYYALAWATHLLNVVLLFAVVLSFTQRPFLASFVACLWGACLANHGTLAWFSVYGHALASTLLLWVLLELAQVARGTRTYTRLTALRWGLLIFAGANSFGTGLAVALSFWAAVWFLAPAPERRARTSLAFAGLWLALAIWYPVQIRWHAALSGAASWSGQGPGLAPEHWGAILRFWGELMALAAALVVAGPFLAWGNEGVVLGPFAGAPPERVLAAAGVVLALVLGFAAWRWWRADRATRGRIAGVLVLFLGAYGIIAAGRAAFFAELGLFFPASIPRYHYEGTLLLAVLLALALGTLPASRALRLSGRAAFAAWLLALPWLYLRADRIYEQRDSEAQFEAVLSRIEQVIAATPAGRTVWIPNVRFAGVGYQEDPADFPGVAGVWIIAHPEPSAGERVRFVERDPEVLRRAAARPHSRAAALIVPTSALPPELRGG